MLVTRISKGLPHLGLLLILVGCSAIVDAEVKPGGIGATCTSSDQCQAGTCGADQLCTASCSGDADCPSPTRCFAESCQAPLSVGALWVGVSAGGEGWTLTHEEGMLEAEARLPYLSWEKKENIVSNEDIDKTIDDFVASGKQVIVANSFSQRDATLRKAKQYPDVKFLVCQSYLSQDDNADSYAAHGEQGWWIAGKVAGNKSLASSSHRIGFVGSFITPETVRHISAFYLGARSVDPQATVEVQWMGFWSDLNSGPRFKYKEGTAEEQSYFYEELLARHLIDHGAVVVAHGADNQRVVKLVDTLTKAGAFEGREQVFSISNDNPQSYRAVVPQPGGDLRPTGEPLSSCLGSPYWNWGPLYTQIFQRMHANTWTPTNVNEPMSADPASSPVGFNLNPIVGIDDSAVRGFINEIATRGWQFIYQGPYTTSGQRDRDGDGVADATQEVSATDTLTNAEYSRMCWYPSGVIERFPADSMDPAADRPARVPDAAFETAPEYAAKRAEMTLAAFPGVAFDCNKNR